MWFICHSTVCDFPYPHGFNNSHNSYSHCWGFACRMLSHTLRVEWAGSAHEDTQKERGKLLCGQQGRAVLGSPARCPLGCLSCAAMVRIKKKMMIFPACFPTIHYMFFFPNGINPNFLLDVLFVAWLWLSTVIREIVAHWPLTSCAHVLLANISVFKILIVQSVQTLLCRFSCLRHKPAPTKRGMKRSGERADFHTSGHGFPPEPAI